MPNNRRLGLLTAAGCVALGVAALSVFGAYGGTFSPYIDFVGQFALQAGLGALGLTLLFAALHRPALAGASAALAIAAYFAINIPAPVQPCAGVPTHRVLFFNVWEENPNIAETVDFVTHQKADIVILAEVNPAFRPVIGELRKLYPYSIECPQIERHCQFYVYSRVPVAGSVERRTQALIEFAATFPDGTISLTGIHAIRPFPFHRAWIQPWQIDLFANTLDKSPEPRLVVGDFNAVSWGAAIRTISRLDAVKPLPSRGTWFARVPWPLRIPIDNALVSDGIACAKKTVGPSAFSDHRPIWVDFALKAQAAAQPPH